MDMKYCYEEVVNLIEGKGKFGNRYGCELSAIMLEKMDSPQKGLPLIHVAGTNGKGSVSAFLCSILKEAGLKVGMFTSPHLLDFRERIQINRNLISKEDVTRLGNLLLEQEFGVKPTMTDYCLVMALLYFKEQQCDVVILETGLGGRLDSTNAVGTPIVSVITKIGFDHMAILGNTLTEIAQEKVGVLKEGTHFICESQEDEVKEVLYQAAKNANVSSIQRIEPIIYPMKEKNLERRKRSETEEIIETIESYPLQIKNTDTFSFAGYEDLKIKMLGLHQFENAGAAILAAKIFLSHIFGNYDEKCLERAVRNGIAQTKWAGRMQVLSTEPFFMVDGAHNSHGVTALCDSLKILFPNEKFHFLFGVMADKDYQEMIQKILPLAMDVTTVTVEYGCAASAEELAEYIKRNGVKAESRENTKEALANIPKHRKEKTIALGSLYFIREIML